MKGLIYHLNRTMDMLRHMETADVHNRNHYFGMLKNHRDAIVRTGELTPEREENAYKVLNQTFDWMAKIAGGSTK